MYGDLKVLKSWRLLIRHVAISLILFSLITSLLYVLSLTGYKYYLTIHRITVLTPMVIPSLIITASYITLILGVAIISLRMPIRFSLILITLSILTVIVGILYGLPYASIVVLLASILAVYLIIKELKLGSLLLGNLVIVLIVIESLSLIFWFSSLLNTPIESLKAIAALSTSIWGSIQWASPILLLVILYSWILRPLLRKYLELLKDFTPRVYSIIIKLKDSVSTLNEIYLNEKIALTIGLVLSIILYILPYLPTVNPRGIPVNVDWIYYHRWLNYMDREGFMWAYYERPDRFLYLWMLYAFKHLLRVDNYTLAVYHNIVLSMVLTFSVWYLARELYGARIASLSAILAPLSHQSLAFLYGGFQANFFTLSLMYVAMALLVKPTMKRILLAIVLLAITPFMHPWTWIQVSTAIAIYSIYKIVKEKRNISMFVATILAIAAIAIARQMLGGWILQPLHVVEPTPQKLSGTIPLIQGLLQGYSYYLWGSLNIPLLYIYVVLAHLILKEPLNPLKTMYIATSIILPIAGTVPLVRMIINIPFEIDASKIALRHKYLLVLLIAVMLNNSIGMAVNSPPLQI